MTLNRRILALKRTVVRMAKSPRLRIPDAERMIRAIDAILAQTPKPVPRVRQTKAKAN